MADDLKFNFFSEVENEISFESFKRFSISSFRFGLVDFKPLREDASAKEKFNYHARDFYHKFCISAWCLSLVMKIVLIFEFDNFMAASPTIMDVATYFLNILKIIFTVIRREDIWKLFEDIKPLFDRRVNENEKYGVKKYLHGYNRVMMIYAAPLISFFAMNALTIIPFLFFGSMVLFLNYWYPFDAFQVKTFPFAYAWVTWLAYFSLMSVLATDSTLYALITILSMEFDILKTDLKNVFKTENASRAEKMHELINRHNKLLDLSDRLQEIYSVTFLFSFVISSMIICLVAFHLSQSDNLAFSTFLLSYLGMMGGPIFLVCMYGQKLIDSSESVAEGVFESDWESVLDNEVKKEIVLIILRAQKTKHLTAMKFYKVSLETFKSILTTTGSYFSLLRSFNQSTK